MDYKPGTDDYVFKRDYRASARLDLQHYLWRDQVGYLIHPRIFLSGLNLRVADVGTGTGTWITDLARLLPSTAVLDGFDINISQCPPQTCLPPNVFMHSFNALETLPEDLVGQFDLVHIRLFMFVVSDPIPLLKNLIRMLKPGGWLQWEEYDNETAHTIKAYPEIASHMFAQLFEHFNKLSSKTNPLWVGNLHKDFEQQGLLDVDIFRVSTAPEKLSTMTDLFMMGWEELIAMVQDEQKARPLRDLFPGAVAETRKGLAHDMDRVTTIGRKL